MNYKLKLTALLVVLIGISFTTYYTFRDITLDVVKAYNHSMLTKESDVIMTAFSRRVESLERITRDWANWDDAYQFVYDQNDEFIQANLIDETLEISNLNMILFFDETGYPIFKKTVNLEGKGDTTIPAEIFSETKSNEKINIKEIVSSGVPQSGFLRTSQGTFMFAIEAVHTSNGEGPANGAILIARYINSSDLDELMQSTGYDIKFIEPTDLERFHKDVTFKALEKGIVVIEEDTQFSIYALAKDSWGNPAKILHIRHDITGQMYVDRLVNVLTAISMGYNVILSLVVAWILAPRIKKPQVLKTK